MKQITKEDLINFEREVVERYKEGNTYGPVHLSGGNEEQLIKIFKKIKDVDWVFTTHRSHYHAYLKSKNRKWVMNEVIKKANSSHINSKKYKIFSSAIVGGIIPIALGVALALKLEHNKFKVVRDVMNFKMEDGPWVWCFVGDMASEMGCFNEAQKYAINFDLPITFVIEDNGLGCNTPTNIVWGAEEYPDDKLCGMVKKLKTFYYNYKRIYPHYGIGEFVVFRKKKIKSQGDYQAYHLK